MIPATIQTRSELPGNASPSRRIPILIVPENTQKRMTLVAKRTYWAMCATSRIMSSVHITVFRIRAETLARTASR